MPTVGYGLESGRPIVDLRALYTKAHFVLVGRHACQLESILSRAACLRLSGSDDSGLGSVVWRWGMERYANWSGNSGVVAYEIGADSVTIQFRDGSIYLYTVSSAGPANIDRMKSLARQGSGLNAFINKQVKNLFARKLRRASSGKSAAWDF